MKNFTTEEIKVIGISQAAAALFSLVSSVTVIVAIIILGRYRIITHRLIMYLNISIFFNSTSFIIRGVGYRAIDNKILCMITGYYGQITAGFILSSIWCIIIEIVLSVCGIKGGKCKEAFYLILIFIVPPVTGVIPFIKDGYGDSSVWCWIRGSIDGEIFLFGVVLQYVLWYIPLYLLIVVGSIVYIVGTIVIGIKITKQSKTYTSDSSREKQKLVLKELQQFRWYPVVFFFINLIPLANRLYDLFGDHQQIVSLWITTGILDGLQGTVVAVFFFANPTTRKSLLTKFRQHYTKKMLNPLSNVDGDRTPLAESPHNSFEAIPSPYKASLSMTQ